MNYICCCLIKRKKKPFLHGLKSALRRKLDMKVQLSALAIQEDPFLQLGFGMYSYFNMVKALMLRISLMMVITVPIMLMYASYDDLTEGKDYMFNQFTLGNMGGADAICSVMPINNQQSALAFSCTSGLI